MKRIYAISVALSAVFLISCGLADVTEDSEFMPSISSKVGCYADSGHVGSMYGCYEFCIREDSTFTFISDDYARDSLFEGYGKISVYGSQNEFGTGGNEWNLDLIGIDKYHNSYKDSWNFSSDMISGANIYLNYMETKYYKSIGYSIVQYKRLFSLKNTSNDTLCGKFGSLLDTTIYTIDSL